MDQPVAPAMEARLPAPFGSIQAHLDEDDRVASVDLSPEPVDQPAGPEPITSAFQAYLEGEADRPEVPVSDVDVTDFQRQVYGALIQVDPGQPVTYGQLAETIGTPGAARAVGQALRSNPLPLVWPCHRVVSADGLGGFGGCPEGSDADPLAIKRWLIEHERANTS